MEALPQTPRARASLRQSRSRSRSKEKSRSRRSQSQPSEESLSQIASVRQVATEIAHCSTRIIVLANEAASIMGSHDTYVDFEGPASQVPKLAHRIREIFGKDVVGRRLVIVNHRSFIDKVTKTPPAAAALARSLQVAMNVSDRIVVWQGEYHFRLFEALETELQCDWSYNGAITSLLEYPANLDLSKIVSRALVMNDMASCRQIKSVIVSGALHVAVKCHLSYDSTAMSIQFENIIPDILSLFMRGQAPTKSRTCIERFISSWRLQPHVADHLKALKKSVQSRVMWSLAGMKNPSAALMSRINKETSPYDLDSFLAVNHIPPHVAQRFRRIPDEVQQQLMANSLTSAKDRAAALVGRMKIYNY